MALAYLALVVAVGYIIVLIMRSRKKVSIHEQDTVTGPDTVEVPAAVPIEKVVRKPRRATQAKKTAPATAPKTRKPRTPK